MILKNKYKSLTFFLLLFISINNYAQETTTKINGIVRTDSIFLDDINIINKTQNFGASSNKKGEFTIYAALGDSILFSSINYKNRVVIISKTHIDNKKMVVYLSDGFNELDEITLNQRIKLDVSNVYINRNMVIEKDERDYKKAPNIRKHVDPLANSSNGISPLGIVYKIADELFLKRMRNKRKQTKKELKKVENDQLYFVENLVINYGKSFFTKDLNIQTDKINVFIDYCEGEGLKDYYKSNEFIIKNFLVKQSIKFNEIQNN